MHRKPILVIAAGLTCVSLALLLIGAGTPEKTSAPVYSMREFELKPGVKPDVFEKFVRNEMAAAEKNLRGLKIQVMKGDRGENKNRYLLVWEFESVTTRDQFFPQEGGWTCGPAFDDAWKQIKAAMEKFNGYVKVKDGYTDYVTIAD